MMERIIGFYRNKKTPTMPTEKNVGIVGIFRAKKARLETGKGHSIRSFGLRPGLRSGIGGNPYFF
jgi:hypothetical protein